MKQHSDVQSQKSVFAILPFGFARQYDGAIFLFTRISGAIYCVIKFCTPNLCLICAFNHYAIMMKVDVTDNQW